MTWPVAEQLDEQPAAGKIQAPCQTGKIDYRIIVPGTCKVLTNVFAASPSKTRSAALVRPTFSGSAEEI
jgi:hypothetical protein